MSRKKQNTSGGKAKAMVQIPPAKIPVEVHDIIRQMATDEDRPTGNMIRQLLLESPRVRARLGEAQAA